MEIIIIIILLFVFVLVKNDDFDWKKVEEDSQVWKKAILKMILGDDNNKR
jgi:hypothetical protein